MNVRSHTKEDGRCGGDTPCLSLIYIYIYMIKHFMTRQSKNTTHLLMWTAYAVSAAIAVSATLYSLHLLRRAFVSDRFVIPSESMAPTLVPGDAVWVNKLLMGARIYTDFNFDRKGVQLKSLRTRGLRPVDYNDIVVFNRANHSGKMKFIINYVYCKRVIGLPGDTLSIVDGHYINNNHEGTLGLKELQDRLERTPDSLIDKYCHRVMCHKIKERPWTIHNFGPLYIPRQGDMIEITPTLAQAHKAILEWETDKRIIVDSTGVVTANGKPFRRHRFKHNYYFMAGDNVLNSQDSRYFGVVPEEYIVGIVGKVEHKQQ